MKIMKTLAAVCIAALTLVSCSKDPEDLIIGSWDVTDGTITSTISGMGPEYDGTHTYNVLDEGDKVTYTFNKDLTFTCVSVMDGESETETGTYVVADNKITLKNAQGENGGEYEIKTIDKKNMTWYVSESETDEDGSYTIEMTINFKKA